MPMGTTTGNELLGCSVMDWEGVAVLSGPRLDTTKCPWQPWVQLAPLGAAQGLPTTTGPGNFKIPKGAWPGMVGGRDALPIIITGPGGSQEQHVGRTRWVPRMLGTA